MAKISSFDQQYESSYTNSLKLKVSEAEDIKNVCKAVARIHYEIMERLRILPGEIIKINGKRRSTAAICLPRLLSSAGNKEIIRIDRLIRYNAAVTIGDYVTIHKINVVPAEKVVIKSSEDNNPPSILIDERYLSDALVNIPISQSDLIAVPYYDRALAFEVISIVPYQNNNNNNNAGSTLYAAIVTQATKFDIIY
jgi:hypothetical protein